MFNIFKKKIDMSDKKILLFTGSPRTGSTLLGQIINFHPNCYISNESKLVQRVVQKNENIDKVLQDIYNDAKEHFSKSLENDKKYGKTIERYQPKWTNMAHLNRETEFIKKDIKYIGDKKAGGVSDVFKQDKDKTINFFNENTNIKQIQIIRNPINAAKSLMKSHNVETFEKACEEIIEKTVLARDLIKQTNNDSYEIYYEDLLKNPVAEIKKVIEFMDLEVNVQWLDKISEIVSNKNNNTFSNEEMTILKITIDKYNCNELLSRYMD